MTLLLLFVEFFKTGLFAIGGGLVTVPYLYEMANKYPWFTPQQLTDMIAIAESTPGPIGVNMATYVGYTSAGIPGSLIATLGLITPSIIVILIIAGFYNAFKNNKYVQSAFYGLRPASSGLIAAAGLGVAVLVVLNQAKYAATGSVMDLINIPNIILMLVLYYFTAKCKKTKGLHAAAFIAASAVIGIVLRLGGV